MEMFQPTAMLTDAIGKRPTVAESTFGVAVIMADAIEASHGGFEQGGCSQARCRHLVMEQEIRPNVVLASLVVRWPHGLIVEKDAARFTHVGNRETVWVVREGAGRGRNNRGRNVWEAGIRNIGKNTSRRSTFEVVPRVQ